MEGRAGRYTFCWKKSTEKHLEAVKQKSGCETLDELHAKLEELGKQICFVTGSGHRESPEQRQWETLDELRQRREGYEQSLAIMGNNRNSYAKTDHDATFMRMKEDHMRNGQLKPAYNVQIGVNSEYITGIAAYSKRTDSGTLQPFLRKMEKNQQAGCEKIVADARYESKDNYVYLESTGQISYKAHELCTKADEKVQSVNWPRGEHEVRRGGGLLYLCGGSPPAAATGEHRTC